MELISTAAAAAATRRRSHHSFSSLSIDYSAMIDWLYTGDLRWYCENTNSANDIDATIKVLETNAVCDDYINAAIVSYPDIFRLRSMDWYFRNRRIGTIAVGSTKRSSFSL